MVFIKILLYFDNVANLKKKFET